MSQPLDKRLVLAILWYLIRAIRASIDAQFLPDDMPEGTVAEHNRQRREAFKALRVAQQIVERLMSNHQYDLEKLLRDTDRGY